MPQFNHLQLSTLGKVAAIGCALIGSVAVPSKVLGQESTVSRLHGEMDAALCANDWDRALNAVHEILALPNLDPEYRESVIAYRFDIIEWRDFGVRLTFDGCDTSLNWDAAINSITGSSSRNPASSSSPSISTAAPTYFGTTCSQFATWQEAQFHYLNGSAPPSLDGDGDGIVCEDLPNTPREDGTIDRRISASGMTVEIFRGGSDDYYIRFSGVDVIGVELPPFSTRSFSSGTEAREHYYEYYSGHG